MHGPSGLPAPEAVGWEPWESGTGKEEALKLLSLSLKKKKALKQPPLETQ